MTPLKLLLLALTTTQVYSFTGPVFHRDSSPLSATKDVMSDIEIMCLENAADLCSYYDECDIEEREAILNRFASETEIMLERIATMTALVRHLKTGDHQHLEDGEVEILRQKISSVVDTEVEGETDASLSP